MANRVLFNDQGVRVSRPGVNVVGANDIDLMLNTAFSLVKPLMRGQFTIEGLDAVAPPNYHEVYFSPAFNAPPLCFFHVGLLWEYEEIKGNQHIGSHLRVYQSTGSGYVPFYRCHVQNDHFTFENGLLGPDAGTFITVNYFVWDYDL